MGLSVWTMEYGLVEDIGTMAMCVCCGYVLANYHELYFLLLVIKTILILFINFYRVKHYYYYVKPSKSWIVLKNPDKMEECKKLFESSPINITVEGKRHLGASIGSAEFKDSYIDEKVAKWKNNVPMC